MLETRAVEKIKTLILCSVTFFWKLCLLWDRVEKYGAGQDNMAHALCMLYKAADKCSMQYLFEKPCWRLCHILVKIQCSNNCASFFHVLTVDWGCWNRHLLLCSLACCLNMKLMCTLICRTTPDFVSTVLQCKCACKVQDALVHSLKNFKKSGSLLNF